MALLVWAAVAYAQDSRELTVSGCLLSNGYAGYQVEDAVLDAVGKTIPFDGDWRKAKLSEQEYTKIYVTHDEAYSQMLQALLETLKKPS